METQVVGQVTSVWRYPVKSMAGEAADEAYISFSGVVGDRACAFHQEGGPASFPYLTARTRREMLLYRPRFRSSDRAWTPVNHAAAHAHADGVTPLYPSMSELDLDVETPDGRVLDVGAAELLAELAEGLPAGRTLRLLRSDRALTDCRPVSLISHQTLTALGEEVGQLPDPRRFRANLYVDLSTRSGFAEDDLVGRVLSIGSRARLLILERDARCRMIGFDPDTLVETPDFLRKVAAEHEGAAGVYAAVLAEGTVRPGDPIALVGALARV